MTEKKTEELEIARQECVRILHAGDAIFSQDDLRELINTIYSGYQYRGAQAKKLARMIDFLTSDSNRYSNPELAGHSQRLCDFLESFQYFLDNNFHEGYQTEDGDTVYILETGETAYETEAFLAEFQLLSVDNENAYRNYRREVSKILQL